MNIIPFPGKLTAPVQQQGRPGRHPKGVVSLRLARLERERRVPMDRTEAILYEARLKLLGILPSGPPKAS